MEEARWLDSYLIQQLLWTDHRMESSNECSRTTDSMEIFPFPSISVSLNAVLSVPSIYQNLSHCEWKNKRLHVDSILVFIRLQQSGMYFPWDSCFCFMLKVITWHSDQIGNDFLLSDVQRKNSCLVPLVKWLRTVVSWGSARRLFLGLISSLPCPCCLSTNQKKRSQE